MARHRRLKVRGEVAYYHVISRTVGQQFLLGDAEKEALLRFIKYYCRMYFVELISFAIMSNHFHLVVKVNPEHLYGDLEVIRRIKLFIRKTNKKKRGQKIPPDAPITALEIAKARKKLEDLSEFVRSVKQTFSRWYNENNNRKGYFWDDRFKSLWLEDGESVLRCSAYVELNPVRAGIVQKPETYRWCSLHYRQFAGKKSQFLSFNGLFSEDILQSTSPTEIHRAYRSLVYYCGNIKRTTLQDLEEGRTVDDARSAISDQLFEQESLRNFNLTPGALMRGRIRHFTDGAVIGSKEFLLKAYSMFGGTVIHKKDRNVYPTGIAPGILTIRRLRN